MKKNLLNVTFILAITIGIGLLLLSCKKDEVNAPGVQKTKISEWSGIFTGTVEDGELSFELYSDNTMIMSWQTLNSSSSASSGSYTLSGTDFDFTISGTASDNKESSSYSMSGQGTLGSESGVGTYFIDFVNPDFFDQSGEWFASNDWSTHATVTFIINLPAEAEGKVGAIYFDNDFNGGNGFIYEDGGELGAGTQHSFELNDIPAGTYYLYGVVWVVNEYGYEPGPGDYIGIYGATYPNIPVQANATVPASGTKTFNIDMVVLTND